MPNSTLIRNFMAATGLDPNDADTYNLLADVMARTNSEPSPDFDEHHTSQMDDNTGQIVLNFDPRGV